MFPLFDVQNRSEALAQLKEAVNFVQMQRESDAPFAVVSMGFTSGEEGVEVIRPFQELGATWWLECIAPFRFGIGFDQEWPVEALRQRILDGPPKR